MNIRQLYLIFIVSFGLFFSSCLSTDSLTALLGNSVQEDSFTNEEAIGALKDALVEGAFNSSENLRKKDAYYGNTLFKILLPPEAKPILNVLDAVPNGTKLVEDLVLRLNRSAESAAKEIVPIFKSAIMNMSVADGIGIVMGSESAATDYLKKATHDELFELYEPRMKKQLETPLILNISAQESWDTLTSVYNDAGIVPNTAARLMGKKEPMPPVTVNLSSYVTEKALDAVFYEIAQEEQKIRKNPLAYTSKLIKKVFSIVLAKK